MSSEKDQKQENNELKKNNEITVTFNKKHLILAITIVVLSPIIVAVGITWPKFLFNHTSADANSWLQFWGSMLGGFIGTLAVIYVAHLQNAKQEEQLQKQNDKQEELLNTQIEYEKVKYQSEKIHKIILDIDDLKGRINEYYQACEIYADLILYGKFHFRAEEYQTKAEESEKLIDKINTDIENLDKEIENIVDEKLTITGASNIIHNIISGNDIADFIYYPEKNNTKYHRLTEACLDSLIQTQSKLTIVKYYLFDVLENINNIKIDKEKLPKFHFKEQFFYSNTAKYYKEYRSLKEK